MQKISFFCFLVACFNSSISFIQHFFSNKANITFLTSIFTFNSFEFNRVCVNIYFLILPDILLSFMTLPMRNIFHIVFYMLDLDSDCWVWGVGVNALSYFQLLSMNASLFAFPLDHYYLPFHLNRCLLVEKKVEIFPASPYYWFNHFSSREIIAKNVTTTSKKVSS